MSEITPNTPNPVREDAYKTELAEKLGIDPQYIPKSPVWRNEEEIKAIAEMFANMSGGGSLPTDPAQDGTYNLQNTVSSGTGTLSWASGSSGGGVLVVHDVEGTLDKTWAEIYAAAQVGPVILFDAPAVYYLVAIGGGEGEYFAAFFGSYGASIMETTTDSESGYPVETQE